MVQQPVSFNLSEQHECLDVRAVATIEDTEVMSPVFFLGLWYLNLSPYIYLLTLDYIYHINKMKKFNFNQWFSVNMQDMLFKQLIINYLLEISNWCSQ